MPVADKPCPVVDGWLDPNRHRMFEACFYTAADKPYSLPGTNSADIVVLAGHTYRQGDAAFNFLWQWRSQRWGVKQGDELWVRTRSSGTAWLVYRATGLHSPARGDLADDASIWGDGPVPGRLLTIGCLQPTDLSQHASRNVVVVWQFNRVGRPA